MYNSRALNAEEFISDKEIRSVLSFAEQNKNNRAEIRRVLNKAAEIKGLSYRDAALLLECEDADLTEEMFRLAKQIKEKIYGKRIVIFAPLYLSNYCVNECGYCPYHCSNRNIKRKKLSQDEIAEEAEALMDMGHKRLALEAGEDPSNCPIDYILESINTIYSVRSGNGAIRRVNVNIAATTEENYRKLKEAGIGTYILFQETYHKPTYERLHPKGPKSDYAYHTEAMDRAMRGGLDDVGIGALFGMYDYRYDLVGLLLHSEHLENTFGVGPHTVSVPRIRPADDVDVTAFPHAVPDDAFLKIVAVLRLALPYTGIIVSTRESEQVRAEALAVGVSQISGASRTSVGGYSEVIEDVGSEQFETEDHRTLDEITLHLCSQGYIPSFCTACYREGRTGDRFMRLAKSGKIADVCQPNALMTLKEYLEDYASEATKKQGMETIMRELENIPSEKVRDIVEKYIGKIGSGERDFRI